MSEYVSLNPSTMLNPTPVVLVSCGEKDHPENRDLVTLAWAGTVNSDPPMVSVSIRKERYSHGLIAGSGEFVVNLVDEKLAKATDFCGVRSGRVSAIARPVHIGRTTHVWDIRLSDDSGKINCISRLTIAVVPLGETPPAR